MRTVVFWTLASVALGSAFMCITRRSPVASALWLVTTLFALSGIYVVLDAQFIAVLQVMVYAGAIMVLFLFVIMLLNLGRARVSDMKGWGGRVVATALFVGLVVELWALKSVILDEQLTVAAGSVARLTEEKGAVGMIAEPLFRDYLVPFEVTSLLLLAALVGAVVLAKRKL